MKHKPLSRRALIRSLGGAAVSLPLLEAMMDHRAFAQAPAPVRYVVVFCGMSVGSGETSGSVNNFFIPDALGALDAPLKLGLEPLEALKNQISIVSNLSIPKGDNGSNIPAAGRGGTAGFHTETIGPLVSGVRSTGGTDPVRDAQGPSHDFIMSELSGGATQFPLLATRVQASQYGGHLTHVTWRDAGEEEVAIVSPQGVFDRLFGNGLPVIGTPDTGPTPEQLALVRSQERHLDVVQRTSLASERLAAQLGGYDQRRVQEHLEAIRTLQTQLTPLSLDAAVPLASTTACLLPGAPGADPAQGSAYSGEEERATLQFDMAHLALACDLTRVVSINMTAGMSLMEIPTSITGIAEANQNDLHELGHSETDRAHALGQQWHTRHLARFLTKLQETPDTSGTLLDNTVVLFLTEAGSGDDAPHNSDGMSVVYAGGAGGRLRLGEHFDGGGAHPTQVIISAMQAAGYSGSTLGEVSGGFGAVLV